MCGPTPSELIFPRVMNASRASKTSSVGVRPFGYAVRFRQPLVRSAVYRVASAGDRQAGHGALAATDPEVDPDRRPWHRAHAAKDPDKLVASEFLHCASGAERRGGIAAAAASWSGRWRSPLTRRASVTSARCRTGEVRGRRLRGRRVTAHDCGRRPARRARSAQMQRTRAQIAFDLRRGSDAPPLLLRAAQRLERLDAELARETYLEALVAAIYAGRLASGTDAINIALAARSALPGSEPLGARHQLLRGLVTRLTEGYGAEAPTLSSALARLSCRSAGT